jgi:hypothetical protein
MVSIIVALLVHIAIVGGLVAVVVMVISSLLFFVGTVTMTLVTIPCHYNFCLLNCR